MISKLQYNNYEIGEFSDEKERTPDEIISLIHDFPWQKQRDYFVVGLTSPSVTIEDNEGNYLKLALYHHSKFIVYNCTANNKLYQKVLPTIELFHNLLIDFDNGEINQSNFKRKSVFNCCKHFKTNDFTYPCSNWNKFYYFFIKSQTGILLSIFLLMWVLLLHDNPITHYGYTILMILVSFPIMGGINLRIYLNYQFHSRNKKLIISKGKEDFFFGDNEQLIQYSKSDILQVNIFQIYSKRSYFSEFAKMEIYLKNGEILVIPNYIINEDLLGKKLKPELIHRINEFVLIK